MPFILSFLIRILMFAVFWWILAEGVIFDAWFAALAVFAVAMVSYRVFPAGEGWRFRLLPLLAFVPVFIRYSVAGGVDVSRRALRSDMSLDSGFLDYPLSCGGRTPFLLAWVVSLLPGTVSIAVDGDIMRVHLLDRGMPVREQIRDLEARLSRLDKTSGEITGLGLR